MFINSNWVLPWNETIPHWDEPNNTPPNIIWYQANNKEEIIKAIEIDNLFRCVVINMNGKFEDYSNVIFHEEYYATIDEEEDYEYCIGFTNKEHFLENTLSKIKSSVSTKIYVEKN
jgi:hypothetical protein